MAKGGVKVVSEKVKRAKTPEQIAKAQRNVELYQQRCKVLADRHVLASEYRAYFGLGVIPEAAVLIQADRFVRNCRSLYGYKGTDLDVLAKYKLAVKAIKDRPTRKAEVQARYNPILKRADMIADTCKKVLQPWRDRIAR